MLAPRIAAGTSASLAHSAKRLNDGSSRATITTIATVKKCRNVATQKHKREYKRAVRDSLRSYSTEAASESAAPQKMSLKNALRKFYMIVHPDRLTGHPKEMKTNDDSFRSLNSYLDTFKNEKATDDDLDQEYTVKFFVPKQGQSGFTVATSTLKQPPRGSSQQNREKLIHDSLVSLFKQCGLDIDVDVAGYGAPAAAQGSTSGSTAGAAADPPLFKALANLSAHLGAHAKKNTPAGKKLAQIYATHQQAFDTSLKRISSKHNAAILMDLPPFHYKSSVDKLQVLTSHLQKLEQALDKLDQSGRGLHSRLGQKTTQIVLSHKKRGWAPTGHFYVDMDQRPDDMVSLFEEHAHPEAFEQLKAFAPKRAQRESTLKSALELASVSSEHNVGVNETYLELLDAIGADIAANSKKWLLPQVARGRVHLKFTNGVSADHIPLDGSTASLLLPVDTTTDRVRTFLAENAAEAAKRFQKLENALKLVKPMLGVKSLTYQPGMDVDHLKEALEKLSQAQDQIRPFVNNINLVIAKQYGINEDQQQLMVKWNFYL